MKRVSKHGFHGYLSHVKTPARQHCMSGCVIARYLTRLGFLSPVVTGDDFKVTIRGKRVERQLPQWAQAMVRVFDRLPGAYSMRTASEYRQPLLRALRKA